MIILGYCCAEAVKNVSDFQEERERDRKFEMEFRIARLSSSLAKIIDL